MRLLLKGYAGRPNGFVRRRHYHPKHRYTRLYFIRQARDGTSEPSGDDRGWRRKGPEAGAIQDMPPFECARLYRLYNTRPDANHRYTTSTTIRDRMIAEGWILGAAYNHPHEDAYSMCVL